MAIKNTQRGFSLLIAVIFMSVMLTFGLELASLAYKQQVLSSTTTQAQYAFYAADAGLECALYADQRLNLFAYPATVPADGTPYRITCDRVTAAAQLPSYNATRLITSSRLSLDSGKHCADVIVYKPNPSISGAKTSIYVQGYNVPCATVASPGGARFSSRGLKASY